MKKRMIRTNYPLFFIKNLFQNCLTFKGTYTPIATSSCLQVVLNTLNNGTIFSSDLFVYSIICGTNRIWPTQKQTTMCLLRSPICQLLYRTMPKYFLLTFCFLLPMIEANAQTASLNDLLDFEELAEGQWNYDVGHLVNEIESEDGCYVRFVADDINNGDGFYFTRYNDRSNGSGSWPSYGYNSNPPPYRPTECKPTEPQLSVNRIIGQGYGCFFLSTMRLKEPGNERRLFIIFSSPISRISGDILDIDGGEAWTVFAYRDQSTVPSTTSNTSNTHLASFSLPVPNAVNQLNLDSKGSEFVLASPRSFKVIEIRLTTTKDSYGGFGIDNLKFSGKCCEWVLTQNRVEDWSWNRCAVLIDKSRLSSTEGVSLLGECLPFFSGKSPNE